MKSLQLLITIFVLTIFKFNISFALVEIDITRGNLDPLPIAISALSLDEKSKNDFKSQLDLEDLGLEISKVVENNLKNTGLFNTINREAYLQKPDIAHLKPRFEDWALIKAQALITGKVSSEKIKQRKNVIIINL